VVNDISTQVFNNFFFSLRHHGGCVAK
jgi:hypothetical protein